MLTEKDYCDYDTSRELKELGFVAGLGEDGCGYCLYDDAWHDQVDRPLLYEAQKWLREVKNLFIEVFVYEGQCGYRVKDTLNEFYDRDLHYYDSRHVIRKEGFLFSSYEEALFEGIKEAIKILKEK